MEKITKILLITLILLYALCCYLLFKYQCDTIKTNMLLKQSVIEQIEEKETYRNKCKMLEDYINSSNLYLDTCDCN